MLIDRAGRRIEYLRLSVTDRCDLRCSYCMPEAFKDYSEPAHWLTFDEIERLVAIFASLGMKRVRLTGGEPLLRRGIAELAHRLAVLPGLEDLSLSTNGTLLGKHAAALRRSGIARLNVSLDSLDRARVRAISKRDVLEQVMTGLKVARTHGFSQIKINMVVLPDHTDDDIDAMVRYCSRNRFILRLIETMPLGESGRNAGHVDLQPVQARLRTRFGLIDGIVSGGGPARYLVSPDGNLQIGFITPLSQHFCDTCNRVRLSADGILYLCLGQERTVDFRTLLRSGASDAALEGALVDALERKPLRHEFRERPERIIRIMASTGG